MNNIEKLYQKTIMDYNNRTDLKKELKNPTMTSRGHNPSCGDDIFIFLDIDEEKNIIKDASFIGSACAISSASTAMLIENIKGKSIDEVKKIFDDFFKMIKVEEYEGDEEILQDATILKFVANMPARVKCGTLAWHTISEMLKEK
ncbi:Fe-S cluster assembly sulfur transfer protein SufU [Oceanivirga miroungae]|uniref:NifU family SUF system FeS assembly protein n=1 Tax=Oceanivirga miroungae TaxID=1130046 RepID=A0A6I8M6T7_9FUSO|nr:SUF system NifU family Fe-S cluster assembly protein [Oceanivirga miroungae]VWL85187.1 NifU family SUF system FeS assembly protein [Oceanivirga miroungae]